MASLISAKYNLKETVSFPLAALHRMIFGYVVSGILHSCSGPRKQSILHFFFQAEDGIRDVERSRGLGDVYKRQVYLGSLSGPNKAQRSPLGVFLITLILDIRTTNCH